MRPPRWWSAHIHKFPVEAVSSCNYEAEVEPRAAGLEPADVDAMWRSVVALYECGLHPAISICVRRRNQVVLDRAIGHLRGNSPTDDRQTPKIPIRHDSPFLFFSASKSMTAMAIHLLDERGAIRLDDAVVEYIPEFGRHGKERITIRHLLTHRAGIPTALGGRIDEELVANPARILDLICDAKPMTAAGRQLAYHAVTGGYVMGEIVHRVTGRDLRQFFGDEILRPIGIRGLNYGVSCDGVDQVPENAVTGTPSLPPQSWLIERALGVGFKEAVRLSNTKEFLTAIIPSGNIVGTADEGSRFFQLLLNEGELDGVRVFDKRTVRRAVAEQSFLEIDAFIGLPIRYGMGFMLGGEWASLYGAHSPRAFGHMGFTNVLVYADPDRELSVCLLTSGKPFITLGQITWFKVARAIARHCKPLSDERQHRFRCYQKL